MHKFLYFTLLLLSVYATKQAVAKCAGLSSRGWRMEFQSLILIDGPPATDQEQAEEEAIWKGLAGFSVFNGGTTVAMDIGIYRAEFRQQ